MLITLSDNPDIHTIDHALKQLENQMATNSAYSYQKVHVTFKEKVSVIVNRYKISKLNEMDVHFFNSRSGNLCYTFYSKRGFQLTDIDYQKISSLSIKKRCEIADQQIAFVRRMGRQIHFNAWRNIRTEIEHTPEKYTQYDKAVVYINSIFDEHVCECIRHAFDHLTEFSYSTSTSKRRHSVEIKLHPDGYLQAWYSCEYPGCLNGAYYLLINHKVATFREKD